jgi:glycosyltransferase involved in cell wall biosynthesis
MKVTVITVCYNSARTIESTLRSVLEQTYPNIEHIVVDGASTDGTIQVISKTPNRVARMLSEPDHGIYDAMNKGIACASGDILCFLNADDVYAGPHVIESAAKEMAAHRLDALFGDVAFFRAGEPQKIIRRYRSHMFTPERISSGWMPAHPALFMRREIYNDLGGFKTHYRIAGDFEFIARAFCRGALHYKHIPQVMVLMQAGGVSTAGLRSKLKLNKEVLQACRENGIQTNLFKILSKYPAKILELFLR